MTGTNQEFCHLDTVAYLQGLADEEVAKHSPIVRCAADSRDPETGSLERTRAAGRAACASTARGRRAA